MRNVFDQYRHFENRLTHALVTCLDESPKLLQSFLKLAGHPAPPSSQIAVRQQYRPGEKDLLDDEVEADRKGLPDAWFDDGDQWALIIESKVKHRTSIEQLRAHRRAGRAFSKSKVLLIALEAAAPDVLREFHCLLWSDVYKWAVRANNDSWAARLA